MALSTVEGSTVVLPPKRICRKLLSGEYRVMVVLVVQAKSSNATICRLPSNRISLSLMVYKIGLWMGHFGSPTPKPTTLWASTPKISAFWSSPKFSLKEFRSRAQRRGVHGKTSIHYKDSQGKPCWKSTRLLKQTEQLAFLYIRRRSRA